MTFESPSSARLKLLVVISSYGEKNLGYLQRIIRNYQRMEFQVRIVVLSDKPKNLGPDVQVVVGLPTRNPWSLPFAHKRIFADNIDEFDLFAYSEDDMDIRSQHIHAFLAVTPSLAVDEIAGFIRYEVDKNGGKSIPEAHGTAHWKPETVSVRGAVTVAEFSNEHAAFYLLTREQLKRAIDSGGFLREPYSGRYDMLCSAATDPYTCCGYRKVICLSQLDSFLIHHLPNRYAGSLGISLEYFREQVFTLMCIAQGRHPVRTLCRLEPCCMQSICSKSFYEEACPELMRRIPSSTTNVVSIGCGFGDLESKLLERGIAVTALPLDSVIGAAAARRGIDVVHGTLEEGMRKLAGRKFDAMIVSNLVHLMEDPERFLNKCVALLGPSGTLLVVGPNLERLPVLLRHGLKHRGATYTTSGMHWITRGQILSWLRQVSLDVWGGWIREKRFQTESGALTEKQKRWAAIRNRIGANRCGRLTGNAWIVVGRNGQNV